MVQEAVGTVVAAAGFRVTATGVVATTIEAQLVALVLGQIQSDHTPKCMWQAVVMDSVVGLVVE